MVAVAASDTKDVDVIIIGGGGEVAVTISKTIANCSQAAV